MAQFPAPREGFVLTHFIVTSDIGRSRHFYADVLGGEVLLEGQPPDRERRCPRHRRAAAKTSSGIIAGGVMMRR